MSVIVALETAGIALTLRRLPLRAAIATGKAVLTVVPRTPYLIVSIEIGIERPFAIVVCESAPFIGASLGSCLTAGTVFLVFEETLYGFPLFSAFHLKYVFSVVSGLTQTEDGAKIAKGERRGKIKLHFVPFSFASASAAPRGGQGYGIFNNL